MILKNGHHVDTVLEHTGRDPTNNFGIVNPPVYHASTILFPSLEALLETRIDRASGAFEGITYGREGTPTTRAFEQAITDLEGGYRAVTLPCGLGAIATSLMAFLKAGDHLLMPDQLYGPARQFCDDVLAKFGVEVTYYDGTIGAGIAGLMKPNTSVVYLESPGSLTFEVQDVPAIAAAAHARGALVLIDNTWATPLGFPAFAHGADISLQASTKYLGGHSDVMNGIIVCSQATYPRLHKLWTDMGVSASSDDCFLALRGLRTLAVRLEHHTRSALAIAEWLRQRAEVAEVIFPALPGSRGHDLWKRDFTGACGLFGVILHPVAKARVDAMLDGLRLFKLGWSWGGFESLIIPAHPERIRTATRWEAMGPYLRLHVGLEDPRDLIADLEDGLARLAS